MKMKEKNMSKDKYIPLLDKERKKKEPPTKMYFSKHKISVDDKSENGRVELTARYEGDERIYREKIAVYNCYIWEYISRTKKAKTEERKLRSKIRKTDEKEIRDKKKQERLSLYGDKKLSTCDEIREDCWLDCWLCCCASIPDHGFLPFLPFTKESVERMAFFNFFKQADEEIDRRIANKGIKHDHGYGR